MAQRPFLAEVLTDRANREVARILASAEALDSMAVEGIVAHLQVDRIALGKPSYLQEPWVRPMRAGRAPDAGLVRRGVYPGQNYEVRYTRYRFPIESGASYTSVGVNGGVILDSDFVVHHGDWIEIRAADDNHRDQLRKDLEGHIETANKIIDDWNDTQRRPLVQVAVAKKQREDRARTARADQLEADGYAPAASTSPQPRRVPLPDTAKQTERAKPVSSASPDGVPYALEADQFADVLAAVRRHHDNVERLPGAGAAAEASEDVHRDSLLSALNMRFVDGTGEAFSKRGKSDIRLVVDDRSYFYAECKIWGGPKTVTDAVEQLVERYLTYRDAFAALVFFVRGRVDTQSIPGTAIDQLTHEHDGSRLDDVEDYPVVSVPVPGKPHTVRLAVVCIVVDETKQAS